ncbi:MAG: hypothetical protein QXQ90_02500 [Desulfurococcaceae archaeon]
MSIKRKALPIAITLILLIPLLNYMAILQTSQLSLEVTPSTGRGQYGETVTVSACGLRPGATVTRIDFVNTYTGQVYSFAVSIPVDETGCFTADIVLGNMSYGLYNILIYEEPPQPPEPLVASEIIQLNETKSITVSALELGINASITATLSTEAYWGYKNYTLVTSTGNATSTLFAAEDGEVYLLTVFLNGEYVKFRLYDRTGTELIDYADVVPQIVDGIYTATWEFNRAEPEVPGLYNNKVVYTWDSSNNVTVLELYYGGRKLEVISAYLRIVYENPDTEYTTEFYYEYPINLTFTDYGIEPVKTDPWIDADAEWYAEFTWDGRTGEAELTVHVEYLPRTIEFPEKYKVEPVVYIDGEPIENGETIYLWTDYEYVVELYGFTPEMNVLVKIEGTTYYIGTIHVDGNTSFIFTVPLEDLEPGKWYTVEITGYYTDGQTTYSYTVYIVVSHPAIYINEVFVQSGGERNLGYVCPDYCINIEARGFPPNSSVYLYLNEELYDEYYVDLNGSLSLSLNVSNLPYQYNTTNKLFIRVIYNSLEYTANATFTIPAIYVENTLVEFNGVYNASIIPATKKITAEAYNFPPNTMIAVYLNDNLVDTYETDENGYALIVLDYHKSMPPGSTGEYRIIATYNDCTYEVKVIFEIQRIEAYFRIINPITQEDVQEPRGSAGYYNETLIVTRNGEPFDYLGDILEIVVLDGLEPGEKVIVKLVGPITIVIYDGEAGPGGELYLSQTIPSIPHGNYIVEIYLPERGYSIQVPWIVDETTTSFTVYPKIVVTRLDSLEVPIVVGSTAVRVFGSGFGPTWSGFVVLLNNTDSIASVNLHSYLFWTVNEYGILVGPGGVQPGITVPLLEPGVYSITLYSKDYDYRVIESGYVYVVNEIANVATKTDVDEIMSKLEEISTGINEVLLNLDYIKPLLEEVAINIIQLLEQQSQAINLLQEIISTMATRDDIQELMSLILDVHDSLYSRIDQLEFTLINALNALESIVLIRINDLESQLVELSQLVLVIHDSLYSRIELLEESVAEALAELQFNLQMRIVELESSLSEFIAEQVEELMLLVLDVYDLLSSRIELLEESVAEALVELENNLLMRIDELESSLTGLIADVNTTLYARIYDLETTLSGLIYERSEYLEGVISEVNATLLSRIDQLEEYLVQLINEKAEYLEELITSVNATLYAKILDVESSLMSRLDQLEEYLTDLVLDVKYQLMEEISNVNSTLIARIDMLESSLTELITTVNATLYDRIVLLELALTELIEDVRFEVLSEISAAKLELSELINVKTVYLEELIKDVNTTLYARIYDLETTLSGLIYERSEYLEGVISEVNATLLERINVLEQAIIDQISSVYTELATRVDELESTLTEFIAEQVEELMLLVFDVYDSLYSRIELLEESVVYALVELENNLLMRIDELESSLTELIDEKTMYLMMLIQEVNETLLVSIKDLEATVISGFNDIEALINGTRTTLRTRIDELESSIRELVFNSTSNLTTMISTVNTTLSSAIVRLEARLVNETSDLRSLVNATRTELVDMINNRTKELTDLLTERADKLEDYVKNESDRLSALINATDKELRKYISGLISDLNTTIQAVLNVHEVRLDYIEELVMNKTESLEKGLASAVRSIEDLREEVAESISAVDSKVDIAISTSGEAKDTASTTMNISIATVVLVIVAIALSSLSYIEIRKRK